MPFKKRVDGEMTALYVYPCGHIIHRECVRSILHDY